jgi:hypothetical protein
MTVRLDGDIIRLEDDCHVEQAESLVVLAQEDPARRVDLSQCRHLHGAVAQVLIAFALPVVGAPADAFLREHLLPSLARTGGSAEAEDPA